MLTRSLLYQPIVKPAKTITTQRLWNKMYYVFTGSGPCAPRQ